MAGPIQIAILANGRQAGRTFDSLATKAKRWGATTVAAGGAAAVVLAKKTVEAASNAQQSIGATEQIFKKYADTVIRRSDAAATALGLSANEYRELANVSGAMLKSSGMPLKRVTELTDQLTRRAADMAATFGGTTREAVEAVSSLLRGEADPIERYGVSIKQSDVNARLAAKGLDKLTGSAKKTAEQQARIDLLMQQSSDSAGQFSRESNTLAGQQQRLAAKLENTKVRIGNMLLPAITRLADYANRKLVPALERGVEWLENNQDEIAGTGRALKNTLLPPLKTLAELARDAVKFVAELPDPVKQLGLQAAIAAAVIPRLTSAVTIAGGAIATTTARTKQFYAELTYAETRAQRTSAIMGRLGGAAKTAAGIGGMLALVEGTKRADSATGTLMTTLGGAATGFAVGGPWGAAVGAVGGLATGLWQANDAAKAANKQFTSADASNYASTLDEITGAATKATRELIALDLQQSGAFTSATNLGVSHRDLVKAVQGNEAAYKRVSAAMWEGGRVTDEQRAAFGDLAGMLPQFTSDYRTLDEVIAGTTRRLEADARATREKNLATGNLAKTFKDVPAEVVTELEARNFKVTKSQINDLSKRYGLIRPEVRTIMRALGVKGVIREVGGVQKVLNNVAETKADPKNFRRGMTELMTQGKTEARKGSSDLQKSLKKSADAKANPQTYLASINRLVGTAKTDASTGSRQIGTELKSGMPAGFAGADGLWSSWVRSAVRSAIAAGRAEAQIKSPSRKTAQIGRYLAAGLVVGMAAKQAAVSKAGKKLMRAALGGIGNGSNGINKALSKVTNFIKKRITGKDQAKREKAALKALKDEYKALEKNGRLQDKINQKLERAKQLLQQRTQAAKDHAAAIKASILAYGSVTSVEEGHLNNPAALVSGMEARVKAAERFATLIAQLTGKLNKTSLQELIDKGVEGGLAAAEALVAGGQTTIAEVNALQDRLNAVATTLGATAVSQFHQAGIDAAQGLVDGLTKRSEKLDKAAKRLAKILIKAVKKELGIKSPSRVGKSLGANFANSIDLGAKVIPIDRTGRTLARQLVDGFGEPTLTARAAWAANNSTDPQQLRLEVHLTADQLSAVEQGRRVVANVNAYRRAGGAA